MQNFQKAICFSYQNLSKKIIEFYITKWATNGKLVKKFPLNVTLFEKCLKIFPKIAFFAQFYPHHGKRDRRIWAFEFSSNDIGNRF